MNVHQRKFLIIALTLAITTVILSPAGVASEVVEVGGPGADVQMSDADNPIERALNMVDDGGEIIINEQYSATNIVKYDSFTVDNEKAVTIRGRGIVPITADATDSAPVVVEDNADKKVKLENLVLAGDAEPGLSTTEHAVMVRSDSRVVLENLTIDSSITGTPIMMVDDIASSEPTGAAVQTSGIYYPQSMSTTVSSVVDTGGDDGVSLRDDLNIDSLDNPDNLLFERIGEVASQDPVRTGEQDENIIVDANTGDDESVLNPFASIQSAVRASSEEAVVRVRPHDDATDGPYNLVTIDGAGVSEQKDLTIVGDVSGTEDRPRVSGFSIEYAGDYAIRDLSILGELSVDAIATVDATNNYWGSINGPDGFLVRFDEEESSVLTEPFCIDSSCSGTSYKNYPICMEIVDRTGASNNVETINCGGTSESDIKITFLDVVKSGGTALITDRREIPYRIETNLTTRTNVDFDFLSSDTGVDEEVSLQIGKDKYEGSINATYGGRIGRMDSQLLNFRPAVGVEVQERRPINYKLAESITLRKPTESDDNVQVGGNQDTNTVAAEIIGGRFQGLTENQTRYVSRYNSGSDAGAFKTDSIPPNEVQSGSVVDSSRGSLEGFENARTANGRPAVITPNSPVNIGFSIDNVPTARQHVLNITYGYQAPSDPQNNMGLQIVDQSSNPIVPTVRETFEPTAAASDGSTIPDKEDVETENVRIPLSPREVNYVNEQGSAYFVLSNERFTQPDNTTFLLYSARLETSDNITDDDNQVGDAGEQDTTIQEELTGNITATLSVDGSINPEYSTYDVEPGEQLDVSITLQNNGDVAISSKYELVDDYAYPDEAYPGTPRNREIDRNNQSTVTKEFSRSLEPGESTTVTKTFTWSELEFGEHEVKLYKVEDDGTRVPVADNDGNQEKFYSYVFQETTLEIVEINTPSEHMVYDNFDSSITVRNIGDLAGNETLNVDFGSWNTSVQVEVGPGDVRGQEISGNTTIRFARDVHPNPDNKFSFTRREYTTKYDQVGSELSVSGPFELSELQFDEYRTNNKYRPNAPFHTETGEFPYRVEAENNFNDTEENRTGVGFPSVNDRMTHTDATTVNLYELEIDQFTVNTNPAASSEQQQKVRPNGIEASVYASAWPYAYPSESNVSDATYPNNFPVEDGEGTLYSASSLDKRAKNRVSVPVNENEAGIFNDPEDDYFSIYASHQARVCNDNLLGVDQVQVPRGSASEGDVGNSFLPFSAANGCSDTRRITNVHAPVFVGEGSIEEGQAGFDSSQDVASKRPSSILPRGVYNTQSELDVYTFNYTAYNDFSGIIGGDNSSMMYATVRVSNSGNGQPATARIEIVSNKSIGGPQVVGISQPEDASFESIWGATEFQDEVVGAAAVRLPPRSSKVVTVPIVIRNVEGVEGTHILKVRPRAAGVDTSGYQSETQFEDYTNYTDEETPPTEIGDSPITGETHRQFEIPINVTAYGDAVLQDIKPVGPDLNARGSQSHAENADIVADEVCRSNDGVQFNHRTQIPGYDTTTGDNGIHSPDGTEGINVLSGRQDPPEGKHRADGTCVSATGEETVTFTANWTNHGGEPITIEPEAIAEFEPRSWYANFQRYNAHVTGDRFVSQYNSGTNAPNLMTFSNQNKTKLTLQPGETKTVEFQRKFQEPGLYHLRVAPCRDVYESTYNGAYGPKYYDLEGFTGIPDSLDQPTTDSNYAYGSEKTVHTDHSRNRGNKPSDSSALQTTGEIQRSVFHGARGCANETISAFIYDVTNPVADFRAAHDETTVKKNTDEYTHAVPQGNDSEQYGDFGFSGTNPRTDVNIIFAVDSSGSVGDKTSDIRSDIKSFIDQQPDRYNYGLETYHDGGQWRSQNLGSYSSNQEFKNFINDVQLQGIPGSSHSTPHTLEPSISQIQNYGSGRNVENYIIALGDGDEFGGNVCNSPDANLDSSDYSTDFTVVTVDFGSFDQDCEDTLKEAADFGPDGEKLYYDATAGDDFISAFNNFANTVIGQRLEVYEGGMLFFDASTTSRFDCGNCYTRPHYEPYRLETPYDSPDFPGGPSDPDSGAGNDFREGLQKADGVVHSHKMSTDNGRIVGAGVPGEFPNGDGEFGTVDNPVIDEKGFEWTIEGGDPNYGQKSFCTEVSQFTADEHCYMEQFHGKHGSEGNTPDYYEVVPHRFTNPTGDAPTTLQVWDDPTLTIGEPNTNTTTRTVNVKQDTSEPTASLEKASFNDLSYDTEDSVGNIWHRMEDVFADHVNYRSSTPTNFDSSSKYDDTYEGARTCLSARSSDAEIGISQDEWTQEGGNTLDSGTRVINDGNYVTEDGNTDRSDGYVDVLGLHKLEVDMSETRDGNRRCLVFEETGPNGNRERTQTFEYYAWDYDLKRVKATEDVDIAKDTTPPEFTDYGTEVNYDSSTSDGGSAGDFIWAYRDSTSSKNGNQDYYRGGDLSFDVDTYDGYGEIGVACVDLRLQRGSGLTDENGNGDIHNNCAIMGDEKNETPIYEGLYGNDAYNGAEYDGMGTNSNDGGYHNDAGWFTAHELSVGDYQYSGSQNAGGQSITYTSEEIYSTDWHGNTKKYTYDNIKVVHDQTRPRITGSASCGQSSCSDHSISVESDGYTGNGGGPGGTPIVDAELVSTTWNQQSRNGVDAGCDGTVTSSSPNYEIKSLPEGEHSGDVVVNNDASVTATTSCSAPPGCGSSCNGPSDVGIEYDWGFKLKIWDAHGNTQTMSFSGTIDDDDYAGEACQSPCPPPPSGP